MVKKIRKVGVIKVDLGFGLDVFFIKKLDKDIVENLEKVVKGFVNNFVMIFL